MQKIISTWKMSYEVVQCAKEALKQGKTMQEAIKVAIQNVESNPSFVSVGTGGLPNQEGYVQLDGAYMNGKDLSFGGVMEAQTIKSPIAVSMDLAKHTYNCLLAGSGADQYAIAQGFAQAEHLTPSSYERYLKAKETALKAYDGHDTVCVIGYDDGHVQVGVSTSGLFMKHPGRVGDSPIIGSGFYADDELGACAATGLGEDIMRGCLSIKTLLKAQQMPLQQALEETLDEHIKRMQKAGRACDAISLIAIDPQGNLGAVTNITQFPFVIYEHDEVQLYCAMYQNGKHNIIKCDEEWIRTYTGD